MTSISVFHSLVHADGRPAYDAVVDLEMVPLNPSKGLFVGGTGGGLPSNRAEFPAWCANGDFTLREGPAGWTYAGIRDYVSLADDPFWCGDWSSTRAYVVGDKVRRSGSTYLCVVAHTNHVPPNATYWSTPAPGGDPGGPTILNDIGDRRRLLSLKCYDTLGNIYKYVDISAGLYNSLIDRWATWLLTQPSLSLVLHHEPDHLPGGFTQFPGSDGTRQPGEFADANGFLFGRLEDQGATNVWAGYCLTAVTARNGDAGDYLDASHRFIALDGYTGSPTNTLLTIFQDGADFAVVNSIDFSIWETNAHAPLSDTQQADFWNLFAEHAAELGAWESSLYVDGITNLMNPPPPATAKWTAYVAAGNDPYFNQGASLAVLDEATELVARARLAVDGNGKWTAGLHPTADISPVGSKYRVTERIDGTTTTWTFTVPGTGGPYDVSTLV